MHMSRRTVPILAAVATLGVALQLTACDAGKGEVDPPRPALVVLPGAAESAAEAFAGDIHARVETQLAFQVGGRLLRRDVDMGARVAKGQVLAELDARDIDAQETAARAQLASAQSDLQLELSQRDRYRALAGKQAVSRAQLDAAENGWKAAAARERQAAAQLAVARNQSDYASLRAPADGVIAQRLAEAGQVVAAGQPVFTLAADGEREVRISIPEQRIGEFRLGQPVQVELWTRQGRMIPGRIRELAPVADPQARTYAARIALPADATVELGQSARVYALADAGAGMSVPLSAVYARDGASALWVVAPEPGAKAADGESIGRLHLQPVRLGPYGAERVPVLAGITRSDWVLAAGVHLVREGQRVLPVDRDDRPVSITEFRTK